MYVKPVGVIEVEPELAVALKPPNVPCVGAVVTLHVSVWLASASLTVNKVLIEVALAFWHTVKVCGVLLVNVGAVLLLGKVKLPGKVAAPVVVVPDVQLPALLIADFAAAKLANPLVEPL